MLKVSITCQRNVHAPLKGFRLSAEFELSAGICGMVGPSGSGKTTLLDALAGILDGVDGLIEYNGETLLHSARRINLPPHKRGLGYVFQDSQLFPHLEVEANLRFGQRYRAHTPSVWKELVSLLRLKRLLRVPVQNLSGGERQRVALARALLTRPKILLLDEPIVGVDSPHRREILPYLKEVYLRYGTPMIYVSHFLEEIFELTDQLIVLKSGSVLGAGSVKNLLNTPTCRNYLETLGVRNVIEGILITHHQDKGVSEIDIGRQSLFLPFNSDIKIGSTVSVSIAPANLILAISKPEGLSTRNTIKGKISELSLIDGQAFVAMDIGHESRLRVKITAGAAQQLGLKIGQEVWCVAKSLAFSWGTAISN